MREIKFRAFIGGKMIGADNLAFEEYGLLKDQLGAELFLMQYTGEKDIKGNDIYEGDIISVFHNEVYDGVEIRKGRGYDLYKVIFYKGMFCVSEDDDLSLGLWIHEEDAECEIIGNIFENKELIK